MAEPTITQVFGAGATQTGSSIIVLKSDLEAVGLTPSASNTAESLLTAIFLIAKASLSQANFESNPDQSIVIAPGFDSIVQRTDSTGQTTSYRQNQFNINLHKLDSDTIDPDDY